MKTVFIVQGDSAYRTLFKALGYELAEHLPDADLVLFTGGEDVSPQLYGDNKHKTTYNNIHRDAAEARIYEQARELGIPCVGICRGGQFLNVMNGGRMYQHVGNHTREHMMQDCFTGEEVFVSSTHHQMFMPAEGAVVVATANLGGFREWYDGGLFKRDESNTDYEVLFYPHSKSLCFQPHPEMMYEKYEGMRQYFANLLTKYLEQ